jgi:hypothetical protein
MRMTPEQLARLPKYAQQHIELLESSLEAARAKLQEGPEDSTATLDPYHDTNRKPLGRNPHIRFKSDNGTRYDLRHDAAANTLKISGNAPNHWDTFVVIPDVSNAVIITHHKVGGN